MSEIKGIIQAIGKLKTWKHVIIALALIAAGLVYSMRHNPTEIHEYYENGKIQKISKF